VHATNREFIHTRIITRYRGNSPLTLAKVYTANTTADAPTWCQLT